MADKSTLKIQSGLAGNDQGNPGWNLSQPDTSAQRDYITRIDFHPPFDSPPHVIVSLAEFDMQTATASTQLGVEAHDITPEGFCLRYYTASDSMVYGAKATWIAYGS